METAGMCGRLPASRARSTLAGFMRIRATLAMLLLLAGTLVQAQSPAPLYDDLGLVVNGRIDAIARQPGGGIVFGGSFTSVNGVPRKNIARLLPDGTLDPDWNPQADNLVTALAVDSTGAVYVAGTYSNIAGQSRNGLAKLLGTGLGQVDPSWSYNSGVGAYAMALAVGADDSLYVGGSFTFLQGLTRSGLGKLSPTGTPDPDWDPSPGTYVTDLALDASGNLYVGGAFNSIGGLLRYGLAKISTTGTGAADPDWNPAAGGSYVRSIAVDGTTVFVGGEFTSMGGASRLNLAKLSTAGTGIADPDWNPSADAEVSTLVLDGNGSIYAGGNFTTIGGVARNRLARLSTAGTGTVDAGWNWPLDSVVPDVVGAFVRIYAIAVDIDGTVYTGGEFTSIGGLPRMGLAALDLAAPAVDVEKPGEVRALARTPNGGMVVGGYFLKAQGQSRRNLLRVLPDGSLDPEWDPQANGKIEALAVDSLGAVFAGGDYTQIGGAVRTRLAKLAPATGETDAGWNAAANGEVLALALEGDGALFVGGGFTEIAGQPRNRIAKLAGVSGAADATWNPGADGVVRALAVDDAQLYVGGDFVNLNSVFRGRIGRLSTGGAGAHDAWHPSANGRVMSLAVGADAVYVGGQFGSIGGQTRSYVAKLDRDAGAADPAWNPNSNSMVRALAVDGSIVYAAGDFQTIGGQSRETLARLLPDGTADTTWHPAPNWSYGFALAFDDNGAIYVGGSFVTVGAQIRQGVAAIPLDKRAQTTLVATATPSSINAGSTSTLGIEGGSGSGAVSFAVTSGASSCSIVGSTLTGTAAGSCTVTATKATDGLYFAATDTVDVTVLQPNQAPSLTLAGNLLHAAGTTGAQTIANFATSNPGANEAGQTVAFMVTTINDANDVMNNVVIDALGALHYTLTGNTGGAVLRVVAQDNGGTANGGQDTSPTREFRILVGDGANIVLEINRNAPVNRALSSMAKGNTLIGYTVEVHNNGPQAVAGLIVRIPAPRGMLDMLWTCSAPGPICAPASGANSVTTSIDLLAGQSATIEVTGAVNPAENYVELRASIQMPAGTNLLSTGDESVTLQEASNAIGIFRGGFE
jgi:hypothetical protein